MSTETFVKVSTDIFVDKGFPSYRLYINDELFTERQFLYEGSFLRETFQILAPPGMYQIRLEKLSKKGSIRLRNTRCELGPVKIIDTQTFKILE